MSKNNIIVIHQPDLIPWIGFFDRLIKSDIFVVLDNVQYIRRGWHHRDKIKTASGSTWLTVPVKKKGRYEQLINEVEIDYSQNVCRTSFYNFQEHCRTMCCVDSASLRKIFLIKFEKYQHFDQYTIILVSNSKGFSQIDYSQNCIK